MSADEPLRTSFALIFGNQIQKCFHGKLHCSRFLLKGSRGLLVPATRFNYTDVRSQRELVKPLWLFSSRALHLSLPRWWHCPASHQLNYPWNILPHASDDALYWEWLSDCAFQLRMKIRRSGRKKNTQARLCMKQLRYPFFFYLYLTVWCWIVCCLAVLRPFPHLLLQILLVFLWSQLPWQQQGHKTGGKFVFQGIDWPIYTGRGGF